MKNKKMSKLNKMSIFGGSSSKVMGTNSWWNNSIGFGIVGSTIVSMIQLIFTIVNSFINKNDETKKSSYNPSYSHSNVKYRISKYPSKSNVFI